MESSEAPNQLLKNKYDLHKSPEVTTAAKRTLLKTGEKVPQDPLVRIQNYLNRFHEIVDQTDPRRREHARDLIKGRFHQKYVIKPGEIPEGYFDNQRRLAREQGYGDIEVAPQQREQLAEILIADQTSSLDKWIDYLSSPDAPYPDAFKYFTLRSVLTMGDYDKEKREFTKRSKGTVKPFPDLNREALAYVLDAFEKKYKGETFDFSKLGEEEQGEFEKLLKGENFARLYAFAIDKVTPASPEQLAVTAGEWKKYSEGSDHMPLYESLQGHGTGWCTAGESTAQAQLQTGDFYVYYSQDYDGKPTVPRAAIRMEGDRIAEVRGIGVEQNLDAAAVPIVEEKLKEFSDGSSYQKRSADMRRLTAIDNKTKDGENLSSQELSFLYEIDSPIEGFGYKKDPRIKELRSQRDPIEDMLIVFGCSKEQIATTSAEIKADTKAYVGKLEPGIFDKVKNIEHVYTSFPEGKIKRLVLEIGGKTKKQLEQELQEAGINISTYAKDILDSKDFTTLPVQESLDTVRLKVQNLGLTRNPTTDQIYARIKELGLDLCPAEVGPNLRLTYRDQPMDEWLYVGMKQIAASGGSPYVFELSRDEDGLWLDDYWANPDYQWSPGNEFVFRVRK